MGQVIQKTQAAPGTKHSASEYLTHHLFQGEEADIQCRQVKLVTARKEHECFLSLSHGNGPHLIAIGELHRLETALVDGSYWGKYRCCLPCMDRDMKGEF